MSMGEWAIMLGFGLPIAALCCAFVVCALWMQMKEERDTQHHSAR